MQHDNNAPPARPVAVIDGPKSLSRRFAKQIAMSIAGSIAAGMILQATNIKHAVLSVCSAAVHIGGDPLTGDGGALNKLEKKVDEAIGKLPGPDSLPLPASLPLPVPIINPFHKTPEQIEAEAKRDREERERKLTAERNRLIARADAVKLAWETDWTLETFAVQLDIAERLAREAPERKRRLADADRLGVAVDPAWELKTLREQVKGAQEEARLDADYQAAHRKWERDMEQYNHNKFYGPNARCPQCKYAMTINSDRYTVQCRKCLYRFGGGRGWAMWEAPKPPEEPQPPRKNPSIFRRVLGASS